MDQKCQEVRVKPSNMQVEVDLSLDTENNYDANVEDTMRITKQTLSSRKAPRTKGYAIGVLVGNKILDLYFKFIYAKPEQYPALSLRPGHPYKSHFKPIPRLHLNPVNAVVQLRPSMEHLKPVGKKNNVTQNVESKFKSDQKTVEAGPSKAKGVKASSEQNTDSNESWVSLEYYGTDSVLSNRYMQNITAQGSAQIQFP